MRKNKVQFQSLKDARKYIDKTQMEIATASGISESYYNLIENRKRPNVPIPIAARIAGNLGITLDEFFLLTNFATCKDIAQ